MNTMLNSPVVREQCAQKLQSLEQQARQLSTFVGLDGFVDAIIHVVDQRHNAESFQRVPTISRLADRIAAAAGKSTNIELVTQQTKLGGNGPIMANALSSFGLKLTYLGALGYPNLHPVFDDFAKRNDVISIAQPGLTDALEFDDGKLMFGKMVQLNEVTWANIQARYGREPFLQKFKSSDLVGFVNWTMIPYMSDVWELILKEICPGISGPRRYIFFDLADPQKRPADHIQRALQLISGFEQYFNVILGLNEKEAYEIGRVLGMNTEDHTPDGLAALAKSIQSRLKINTLVVHPVSFALAVSGDDVPMVEGPFCAKPLITTGAGDHFNAGFCLGKLLGFDNTLALLTGVSTSGFYVRTAKSPTIHDLANLLLDWPSK
ncbi:MAG TPA: hypothetical protein P5186_13280 [Candidatus Paceibacterota bacterium]|nr:hypothetical protein [Verrucomicrobiota bacterium]HRY49013.1 hypothetical protein [Candidatus Paceibacterota bacterium]HRZ99518.1 hypothetical protein [Candidatus Paceibacterota bacterium]